MAPAILVGLLFVFVLLAIAGNSDSDKASNAASGSSVSAVVDAITPRKSPLKVQVNELAEMIASRAEKGERTIRGGSIIQHYTLDKERFDLPSLIAIHRSAWSEFVELDEFDPTATSRAFNIAAFTLGVQLYQAGMNGAEVSDVVTELTMVGEHPYVKRWLESVPELQAYRRLKLAASELEKREGLTTALGRNDELRYESLTQLARC